MIVIADAFNVGPGPALAVLGALVVRRGRAAVGRGDRETTA